MRASIIILFLSSFLCFGGTFKAPKRVDAHRSFVGLSNELNQDKNDQVGSSNFHAFITTDNELLLVEESCNTDDAPTTFFALKNAVAKKCYPSLTSTIIIKDNFRGFKSFRSFCGYSQPIYISQRVLRI
tara:strand:+ start:524 stop:910 length:387 start_codon:yes stop_codon:yes gene_type:complete